MRRPCVCLVIVFLVDTVMFSEAGGQNTGRPINVGVNGQVTPPVVKVGEPIPLTVTVSNGLGVPVFHSTFALKPNDWNGETHNVSLVDIYRDGKESNLHLARPEINVPHLVAGIGRTGVEPGKSLQIETDARKWKLRDGWLPGRYEVTVRVDGLEIDPYYRLSVLSGPFEFEIQGETVPAVSWGKPKDGVVCGLSVGCDRYVLGQPVELAVYLKNTRDEKVTCNVSRFHGAWVRGPRDDELYMMVDALGGQHVEGEPHTIPADQVRRILITECPTRPTGNRASDLHFTPGRTRVVVRCTPLFDKTDGGIFADRGYGACTGEVSVEVVDPPERDGERGRAEADRNVPAGPPGGDRAVVPVNTQKTLIEAVGKQFTDTEWEYPSDLLPDTFPGLEHVSGPGDPGVSGKAAWRKPVTLKHGPSGTEVFVNCYRRRKQLAQPLDPNLPGTPLLPLTEPDYRYQSADFHALKAAAARETTRDVFVFLDGDIMFKVEVSGVTLELRRGLVRSTAEAIWKFRHRRDAGTIRGFFRPTKEKFFSDEPITVEMVVHNDGTEDFRFHKGGDYRLTGGRHDRFFVAFGGSSPMFTSNGGGLHGLGIVPAKGVYKEVIDLTPWGPPGPDDQGVIRVTCRRTLTTQVATKLLVRCLEQKPIDYTRKDARAILIAEMTRLNQRRAGFADDREKQKEIERVVDLYMRYPQIQSTFECRVNGRVKAGQAQEHSIATLEPEQALQSRRAENEAIEQAIDHMLSGLGHKTVMQARIDAVVGFGEDAVPLLMKRYGMTDDDRSWPLVSSLCQIATPTAREFVRQILTDHRERRATITVIRDYPVEHEGDIVGLLIELLHVRRQQYDASERLKEIIQRKPARAGELVQALEDEAESEGFSYQLGEILAFVSGYSHTWCVSIPPGEDVVVFRNGFWRDWWSRNRYKDVFGWLVEAVTSDNDSRKARALQRMGASGDRRAIPYFIKGLNSQSESVQYWAVVGLKGIEGSLPATGYPYESFEREKIRIIPRLKQEFE
ncbi:MAG: hypothetical protein H8E44_07875 [Planctomycetes bacterium]|nr:hypothetical protein [Planctomycetota bacterium]MBL7041128.1 hypothetical protein [Pirellulaceae bacterium]